MPFAYQFARSVRYGALRALRNCTIPFIFAGTMAFAEPVTLVALGDSLTAGYGLPAEQGLVPQLQAYLKAQGVDVVVQNAGVSGDTTAGGLSRLNWALGDAADAMIVTLGGNDMLRGIDPVSVRSNLESILVEAKARGVPVLLVGMKAPGNYGPDYKAAFDAIYPELAGKYGTGLVDSFFAPIFLGPDQRLNADLMQGDGIHPNADGVAAVVAMLGPAVVELLQQATPAP